MLDPERSRGLGEYYSRSPLSRFAGFYTYRYCYLFHRTLEHLYDGTIHNRKTLLEADEKLNIIQHMLQTEKLTDGILELFESAGISLDKENRNKIIKLDRTNPSSRNKEFSLYYNKETSDLVERRDALIVEKYGYSPPEVKEL